MFDAISLLSALCLLMIAGGIFLVSQKIKSVPYTVILVIAGIGIAYAAKIFGLDFITSFELTPELLFYIFLPTLIFEAAYNVPLKKFYQSFFSISLLSTLGLIIAALVVAVITQFVLGLFGFEVPFIILLLFGSIISATDPVGVLSLFKSLGAPKKLSLMFEGESLFNDATAVALFLSILAIIQSGKGIDSASLGSAGMMFITMIVLGIIFGLLVGKLFSWIINKSKNSELVTLLFMLVMAHTTFVLSELLNEYMLGIGMAIGISPIIATTIASMELGNDGGLAIPPKIKHFVHHFWHQISFFVNSIIFLLVGILVVKQGILSAELVIPTIVAAVAVFIARIISVYPLLTLVGWLGLEEKVPQTWRVLMSWASIRGALSIIMVLTLPDNLFIDNWSFIVSPRDFVISLTLGSVLASLLGKMLTVPSLLKRLKILGLDSAEKIILSETKRFVNVLKLKKLESAYKKGYVTQYSFDELSKQIEKSIQGCPLGDSHIFNDIIQHYALGVEKYHLEQLYGRNEITMPLFMRLYTKIDGQEIDIEQSRAQEVTSNRFVKYQIDTFERKCSTSVKEMSLQDRFLYYRALAITARKVIHDLAEKNFPESYAQQVQKVVTRYTQYKQRNQEKMAELESEHPLEIHSLLSDMGAHMLDDYQEQVLDELVATHFTTERVRAHFSK